MTSNEYPLSLVELESLTVVVTIKVSAVPCRAVSLVDIVTIRPDTDIHAKFVRSGVKVNVSVWLQPGS